MRTSKIQIPKKQMYQKQIKTVKSKLQITKTVKSKQKIPVKEVQKYKQKI